MYRFFPGSFCKSAEGALFLALAGRAVPANWSTLRRSHDREKYFRYLYIHTY